MKILLLLVIILSVGVLVGCYYKINSEEIKIKDAQNGDIDNNDIDSENMELDENEEVSTGVKIQIIGTIDNNSFEAVVEGNNSTFRYENVEEIFRKLDINDDDFAIIEFETNEDGQNIVEVICILKTETGKYQGVSNNVIEIKTCGFPDELPVMKFIVDDQILNQINEIGIKINENIIFGYYVNEIGVIHIVEINDF
jgi:hypothetical protein